VLEAFANNDVNALVLHPLLDTLLDFEPGGTRLIPRLAERWEVSEDGLLYRFWLREGLRYADGSPIVAADLEHAIERPRALETSPFRAHLDPIACVSWLTDCTGVRALDERELEIRLERPSPVFQYVLAMKFTAPLPRAHLGRAGGELRRGSLASGPYRLAEWIEGQRIVLERNPHYRDPDRQRPERIVMLENVPRDMQFLMFERGELDLAEKLSPPDYMWLRGRVDWAPYVQEMAQLSTFGARFHVGTRPFDDRRVRQAFNYAVNKRNTRKLLAGTSMPAHGILPPGMLGHDAALEPYPYDPAKARALLAEAGYPNGLSIDYVVHQDEEAVKIATAMQADLAAAGIAMRISIVALPVLMTNLGQRQGGAPFMFAGWAADFPDPSAFMDPVFHSRSISDESSTNFSFYKSPALDDVLDRARAERDPDRRAELYRQAERILYDDAPWLWNYHQLVTEVSQPYVRGYRLHPIWIRDVTTAWLDLGPGGERLSQ
jgi:ABC-type transport system substrate-binding protein